MTFAAAILFVLTALMASPSSKANDRNAMFPELQKYIDHRAAEFDLIDDERKKQLAEVAKYIAACWAENEPALLTFICTHNSRRSHMSQIWAATSAAHYGIAGVCDSDGDCDLDRAYDLERVYTYSGGTEGTAFNPRAVSALVRAGFEINKTTADRNPIYQVRFGPGVMPMTCFSKVYNQAPNPQSEFAAIMTCSQADRACPSVSGASKRFAIPYEDPKAHDGTHHEATAYDERCQQIAREMLYVFSQLNRSSAD